MTCNAFYDHEDRGYVCEQAPGHEPPHRETIDYRIDGFGYRTVTEWWNSWGNDRASGRVWDSL
jgi:hypothetical protein